jgi:hypothetical protein
MKTDQKNFVVDACIMKAAGQTAGTSSNCRKFLSLILDNEHKVVITEEIKKEWENHQSSFSSEWRIAMTRKNLTFRPENSKLSEHIDLKNQIDNTLKTDIKFKDSKYYEDVNKDFHLVQAALVSDKLVSSLDDKMKKILTKICDEHTVLKTISWLNPDKQCETTTDWFINGCKTTPDFLIG